MYQSTCWVKVGLVYIYTALVQGGPGLQAIHDNIVRWLLAMSKFFLRTRSNYWLFVKRLAVIYFFNYLARYHRFRKYRYRKKMNLTDEPRIAMNSFSSAANRSLIMTTAPDRGSR